MFRLMMMDVDSSDLISLPSDNELVISSIASENGKFYLYGWIKGQEGNNYLRKIYPAEKIDKILMNFLVLKGTVLLTLTIIKNGRLHLFMEIPRIYDEILPSIWDDSEKDYGEIKFGIIDDKNFIMWLTEELREVHFLHIKTKWKMETEDVNSSVKGILQNRMVFSPKVFCSEWSPIVAYVHENQIKGEAEYHEIAAYSGGHLVEFNAYSHWFGDFFKNVLSKNAGPFIYWGYSDGRKNLTNNFVILSNSEVEFLRGLRQHWKEDIRRKHKNSIDKIYYVNRIDL